MQHQIITTEDGSKTIFIPALNEQYHSVHGAMQETLHVFIAQGWKKIAKNELSILEIGWGTGLTTILSLIAAQKDNKIVHYCGLEAYPLSMDEIRELNYTQLPYISPYKEYFTAFHSADWNKKVMIHPTFSLQKIQKKMQEYHPEEAKFDLIYFDAFAPSVQPKMWSIEVLEKMYFSLCMNGVFVTYCAKGEVRRSLEKVGFTVERLPGPPGKREMLRGIKI